MHLFLNVSVKEMQIFTRKYYLIAELLIFKYRWQNISNSNTATCLAASYFSTGQRSCPQGARDHAAVNLWNTRLHCSSSVASQHPDLNPVDYQIWGNLQERVYRSCVHDPRRGCRAGVHRQRGRSRAAACPARCVTTGRDDVSREIPVITGFRSFVYKQSVPRARTLVSIPLGDRINNNYDFTKF